VGPEPADDLPQSPALKAMWEAALPVEVDLDEPESRVFDSGLHRGEFDLANDTWYAD